MFYLILIDQKVVKLKDIHFCVAKNYKPTWTQNHPLAEGWFCVLRWNKFEKQHQFKYLLTKISLSTSKDQFNSE